MIKSLHEHIVKETRNSFLINLAINGSLAWFIFRHRPTLALWGPNGFGQDMLVTALLLWLLLSVIVIAINRKKSKAGEFPQIAASDYPFMRRALRWLPRGIWAASTCLGFVGVILCALPLLIAFHVLDVSMMSPLNYSIFKGLWAGAMAAVATPIAILFPLLIPVAIGRTNASA
ncbi:MAG: hypothetical protein JWM78_268 [Verrucomicrobiaceae bacterium]|nr:hypothetical protein [Verrucomicrobiaceae bacterium]